MERGSAREEKRSGHARPPGYRVALEPCPKRVRVLFNRETVADSTRVALMHETGHVPVYYFPRDDVATEHLRPTDHATHCPFKGDACYWTVSVAGREAENAAWAYPRPVAEVADLRGYIAFYWDRMDTWLEEDEEVFVHARDPYKRIDVVASARPVRVVLGGETVAETTRALFLFETGLPVRYYIPRDDVRRDRLEPSERHTRCPYKGTASYHSIRIGGRRHEDVVWFYPEPLPEVGRIADRLCFFNEHVDAIYVGGAAVPKVETPWSRDPAAGGSPE